MFSLLFWVAATALGMMNFWIISSPSGEIKLGIKKFVTFACGIAYRHLMSFSESYNSRVARSVRKLCWLSMLSCLQFINQSIAQDCDSPCDGIDAVDAFEVWIDSEGVCAPFVATLMNDVPSPFCGDFSFEWNIQGGQYEWSDGSTAFDASPSIVFLESVFYQIELSVSASDSPTCAIVSSPLYVGAAESPEVSITEGGQICAFDTWETLVYVNPGNTAISSFAWIVNGDSIVSNSPAPLTMPFEQAGAFEVVAYVENTCGTASDTSFVEVRALPEVSVDYDYDWICQGASVELSASGADDYIWSSSASLLSGGGDGDSVAVYQMNSTIVGGLEGSTNYGSLSCTASTGFQMNSFFVPGVSISGEELICDGNLVEFEPSVQSFGWSTSQTWLFVDSIIAGGDLDLSDLDLAPGDYSVSAQVAFDPFPVWLQPEGCAGSAQFDFSIANLPEVVAPQDLMFCNQDFNETLPEGSPDGGHWEGPSVLEGFFNPGWVELGSVPLEYHFADSNGCSSMDTSYVLINEPVLASAGLDSSICESNDWVNLAGFDEVESGIWSGPALMDPYAGLVDVGELEAGESEFVYQVGEGSCATLDTVIWNVMEHPVALLSTQGSLACDADTVWFELYAGGGTLAEGSDYSVTWSDGVQFTVANDPFWIADVEEGFSFVFVEVFDDEGCSDAGSAFIEPIELPEIVLPEVWQLCNQSLEVNLPLVEPALGVWSGEGVIDSIGVFNPAVMGEGIHQLIYTATGPVGCTDSAAMPVEISALDTISAGLDQVICQGTPELSMIDYLPATGGWWSGEGVLDSTSHIILTEGLSVGFHEYIFRTGSSSCTQQDTVVIEVRSLPNATIEYESYSFCPDDSIALSALPFGGTVDGSMDYDLEWSGVGVQTADGEFFMLAPPAGPDTSLVQLTIADTMGCTNVIDANFLIRPRPEVWVQEQIAACDQSIAISFPAANPTGGSWELPDAIGVTGNEVEDFLPSAFGIGSWPMVYTFEDEFGCSASDTTTIEVVAPVVLDLTSQLEACVDASVIQLPEINGAIGAWVGPGLLDEIEGSVDLTALDVGQFQYFYSIGEASCLVTDSLNLVIHDLPVIALEMESALCAGDLTFELPMASPANGIWSGPGVLDSIGGTFDVNLAANDYLIEYSVQDDSTSCWNSAHHIVNMNSVPVADFPIISQQCVGEALTVFSSSTAVESYTWLFADTLVSISADATVVFGEEGSVNLSLTVVNEWGCIDSVGQEVQWIAPPVAEFSLTEDSGCAPLSIGMESAATGQIDLIQWSLDGAELMLQSGDSILFEVPSSASGHVLEMLVSNSCGVDSMQDTLVVLDVPSIEILETIEGGCSPFLAEFAFESEGTFDVLTWNFDNGEETNGFEPVWPIFEAESEPVEYFAFLMASNACGSAVDSTSVAVVPSLTQAQFDLDVTSGCLPLSITATDFSSGGDAVDFAFGDGTMASDSVAYHTYTNPGTYVITQTVSGACSVDSLEVNVTVHPAIQLEFAAASENVCLGDSVWFDVVPSAAASPIQIEWSSPLGVELFAAPAQIGMTTGGLQTLSATATDSLHGCSAQTSFEIFVHNPLVIAVDSNVQSSCSPLEVTLENQTEGAGQWLWSIDDEIPFSSAFSPELYLTNEGDVPLEHWVQVAVVNEWGCSSQDSVHVEVLPSAASTFELLDSIACGVPSIMTPQVEASEWSQLAWFIDSVLVSAESSVELEFLSPGNHVITLMSENEFGCHGFAQDSVEILVLPQVSLAASPLMGCAPHLLEVEHASIDAVEWLLEIHLDSTLVFESDSETAEVMLEMPGAYEVSYTAVSDRGCVASIALEDSVVVLPRPIVGFYANPYAGTFDAPDPLNSSWAFENVSDVGQAIWDFGDGNLSSEWHGTHAYDASGTYEVLLTVINDFGCASEFMMMVEVLESLEVYVPNAFTPPEQGYADGINDGWKPVLSDPALVDRYELVVYNRYGQKVWETQDHSAHWIGEAKVGGSHFAPGGIYTWVLQIDSQAFSESSRQWKGQVNLLR